MGLVLLLDVLCVFRGDATACTAPGTRTVLGTASACMRPGHHAWEARI